jgi:hypothetical protein
VELTIAQRKAGTLPVQPARAKVVSGQGAVGGYKTVADKDVAVRRGDVLHGRLTLDNPGGTVLVSGTGLGLVWLELYGHNYTVASGKDPAVRIVSREGKVCHAVPLEDLFPPKDSAGFLRTGGREPVVV